MTAVTDRPIHLPETGPRHYLAEVRAFLTPQLLKEIEQRQQHRLLAVFTLLRRLRPGDVRTAMLCHRALLMEAREDTRDMGFIDVSWADLTRLVYNVMDSEGYNFQDGHWKPDPAWPPR
jgi:hypothetical protein